MISCFIIYFNLQDIHELGVITTLLSILISPILMISVNLISFLFELNIDWIIWNSNSYSWWFLAVILVTGFFTWFKLCPMIFHCVIKQFKKLKE